MIYHIITDIWPFHMKCVGISSKASHIHIQCGKFSKHLMDLRNDIQKQLYKFTKYFFSKLLQSAIGLNFVSDNSYIISYHYLILFDPIIEGLWLWLHKGGLGGRGKCVLCRSGIMDDRQDQIFRIKYVSNTTLQLSLEWNCKGGKEKLIASGPQHPTIKVFMEKWRQHSIDS